MGSNINIELPNWRKNINYITLRIFPFVLSVITVYAVILNFKEMPKAYSYVLLIGIPALSVYMFFTKYSVQTIIKPPYIQVYKNSFRGKEESNINFNSIHKLTCKIRYGKYGGTFFYLHTSANKKIEFITIPVTNMKKEYTDLIIKELEAIVGKTVEFV